MPELSHDEVQSALDIARGLVLVGIPVFSAPPAENALGFALPPRWQQTLRGDVSGVDRWQPGWALCAVMGHGLDLIDVDPRNGGSWPAEVPVPETYGAASTPSGGVHSFVRSLGVRSRDGVFPGVDVKAGVDGVGHGFVFLSPTVKSSKVTGQATPYRWLIRPEPSRIQGSFHDASGAPLAHHIRAIQESSGLGAQRVPADLDPAFAEFFSQREPQSTQAADRAIHRALADAALPASAGGGYRIRLMRAALTLGGYVGAGHLDESTAYEYLLGSVLAAWDNHPDADDELWIRQGLADGAARPFTVYRPGDGSDQPRRDPAAVGEGPAPWSLFGSLGWTFDPAGDGSDQGLADAALRFLHPVLRVARDTGSWLVRGQDRWSESPTDLAAWSVSTVSQLMPAGAVPIPKDHADRTEAHWQAVRYGLFRSAAGGGKVANKMRSLVSGPGHPVSVELSELDADAETFWAGGVPWDLRAGAPRDGVDPATPHLHSARYTPVNGPTPLWDAFTEAVWPDAEIRQWALSVLSVGFTGYSPRVMPVLYGDTGRGKTQVVALLCDLLGTYGGEADQKLIVAPEAHGSVVYSLKGKRLAYIDEPAPTARDKVERVKLLTGGGRMTGNQMRCNPVSWDPTHTLVLMQNDPPELTDSALRDRARVIHCDGDPAAVAAARAAIGTVDSHQRSPQWAAEAPAVLAAMMRLAGVWLRDSSVLAHRHTPSAFQDMVAEMVASQDPVNRWMQERCNPAQPGTASTALHNDFGTWFSQHPEYRRKAVPNLIVFGRRLTELGIGTTVTRGPKLRHLDLKAGGWFGQAPTPSGFVADHGGSDGGSHDGPATADNTRSTPVSSDGMADVADTSPVDSNNTYINDTEEIYTGNGTGTPDPPPDSKNTGSDLALFGNGGSATAPATVPGHVVEAVIEAVGDQDLWKVTQGLSRTAAAKVRKAAERAAAVAAVAGPLIELPALVVRGQYPVAVDHFGAEHRVRDALRLSEGHLTVDCETTGYPLGHPDYALRTVQLGTAEVAADFDPECSKCRAVVATLLGMAEILHAHNAAADLAPLAHAGLIDHDVAWSRMWDTVLPAKLADPTSTGGDPALKAAASAVLGVDAVSTAADAARADLFTTARWSSSVSPTDPVEKSGWHQVDPRCATMITYAASDVLDTAALATVLPAPDPAVHERERRLQAIVSRPAYHGFPLDRERVLEQNTLHENAATTLHTRIRTELGIDNPGSPAQVAVALLQQGAALPRTKSGKPSVAKDVLEPLRHAEGPVGDAARVMLEWRHLDTMLKLMLRPWKIAVTHGDGRIRPTVYTLGADTGRMSCVRPNVQQVSKKGGMRECIIADQGHSIISADFSGVELRVAAALSGDMTLRQMITDDVDLHREIATQVFGADQADECRTLAKRIVFGRIYGGGVATLAKQAGVSESIAASAVDVMDSITPTLAAWSEQVRQAIRAGHRAFTTYSGRVVHLDPKLPHKGPNYLIQGTARELLADAILAWDRTEFGGGLIMPVHDEIVAMVPTERADEALTTLLECMTTELNGIPIVAAAGGPPAPGWHSG